ARKAGGDRFICLGQLRQSHSYGSGSPGKNFGVGYFGLLTPLPSRVWAALGGLRTGGLDHAGLDASLSRPGGPLPVSERLAILRQLVEYWHGPIGPESGLPEEDLTRPMPEPLRWWYRLAGRRRIVDGHNWLSHQTS